MKLETIKTNTQEVCVEGRSVTITVTEWSNHCGVNVIMTTPDLAVRMAASLRWEDVDVLMLAIAASATKTPNA